MGLEDIVCSIESAKRLKELGVKHESCFVWVQSWIVNTSTGINNFEWGIEFAYERHNGDYIRKYEYNHREHYSAFTIQELIDKLPNNILIEREGKLISYRLDSERFTFVANVEGTDIRPSWIVNYRCADFLFNSHTAEFQAMGPSLFNKTYNNNGAEAYSQLLIKLIEEKYLKIEEL